MSFLGIHPQVWSSWAEIAAWFFGSLGVLLLIRSLLLRTLARRAQPDSYRMLITQTIRWPSVFWAVAAAAKIGLDFVQLSANQSKVASHLFSAALIISFSLFCGSLGVRTAGLFGQRHGSFAGITGLTKTFVQVVVYSIGALLLLHDIGLTITPILTALGVGGLAVALALQDTLSNFFAGVHILIENPFRVGDFITLSTGEEGIVADVGWRTTRLRTLAGNTIVVPNNKVTTTALTNFSMPEARMSTTIDIHVAPTADLDLVRTLALEAAAEAEEVLRDTPPLFLFDPGPFPTHYHARLFVPIAERVKQGVARSNVRLLLDKKFKQHQIPLPIGGRLIGWPPA